jgi:hypothetical protein
MLQTELALYYLQLACAVTRKYPKAFVDLAFSLSGDSA